MHIYAYTNINVDHHIADFNRSTGHEHRLAADRHPNHRTADIHRAACYRYNPTANCNRATDGGR